MGRRKREPMSEGKKNIIGMLPEEYDIKSAKDIEDALKDILGGTIQEMLELEMDEHLGYHEYERSDNPDYRNGKKTKKIRGNFGETEIEVPQDRDGRIAEMLVHFRLQHLLDRIAEKVLQRILDILCRLDVVFLKQHPDDVFLSLTHWFSFSSSHKYSASCVDISILLQLTDFLQSFFQRVE